MKKIILSLMVLATISLNAQEAVTGFSEGNIAITTGLGFSSNDNGTTKTSTFEITPEVMYMFKNNWGISGMIGYNSSSTEPSAGGPSVDVSGFSVGAGVKHFFTPANRLSFYLGADAMGNFGDNGAGGAEGTTFGINFRPGVNYFIHNNWAFSSDFNLASLRIVSPEGGETSTNFGINKWTPFTGLNFKLSYVIK